MELKQTPTAYVSPEISEDKPTNLAAKFQKAKLDGDTERMSKLTGEINGLFTAAESCEGFISGVQLTDEFMDGQNGELRFLLSTTEQKNLSNSDVVHRPDADIYIGDHRFPPGIQFVYDTKVRVAPRGQRTYNMGEIKFVDCDFSGTDFKGVIISVDPVAHPKTAAALEAVGFEVVGAQTTRTTK